MMMITKTAGCILAAIVLVGCSSRPDRVEVPEYDPDQIGVQAVELYDLDGDGSLAGDELGEVKSLESAMGQVDADGDKEITGEEIAARVAPLSASPCRVVGRVLHLDQRRATCEGSESDL